MNVDLQVQIKEDHVLIQFTGPTAGMKMPYEQAFRFEGLLRTAASKIPLKGKTFAGIVTNDRIGVDSFAEDVVFEFPRTKTLRLDEPGVLELAKRIRTNALKIERDVKKVLTGK